MYNTLRTKKHKTRAALSTASEHNLRLSTRGNIDAALTHLNRVLFDSLNLDLTRAASFQERLTEHYQTKGVKERQNSVLAMEFVVSASPEFFEKHPDQRDEWAQEQIEFFKAQFGGNLKMAVLHLDEKTPHLHLMVSTDETKQRRYKNRHGQGVKESTNLNANRFNPQFLRNLHTAHAKHNARFGLVRGRPGSKAVHKTLKQHQAELTEQLEIVKRESSKVAMFDRMKKLAMTFMEQFYELFEIAEHANFTPEDMVRLQKVRSNMDSITGRNPKPKAKAKSQSI